MKKRWSRSKGHLCTLKIGEDPAWSPVGLHTGSTLCQKQSCCMMCILLKNLSIRSLFRRLESYALVSIECHKHWEHVDFNQSISLIFSLNVDVSFIDVKLLIFFIVVFFLLRTFRSNVYAYPGCVEPAVI